MQSYIASKKAGDKVKITIFRFDDLKDIEITLGSDPRRNYTISPDDGAADAQKALLNSYIGNN